MSNCPVCNNELDDGYCFDCEHDLFDDPEWFLQKARQRIAELEIIVAGNEAVTERIAELEGRIELLTAANEAILSESTEEIERLTNEIKAAIPHNQERRYEMNRLQKDNERLRAALQSIAANTCCEPCQEAALVAREALRENI